MIEIVLTVIILALLGLIGILEYHNRHERAKMLNLIVAKNSQEAINLQLADQTKIEPAKVADPMQDLVDTSQATDKQFDDYIRSVVEPYA